MPRWYVLCLTLALAGCSPRRELAATAHPVSLSKAEDGQIMLIALDLSPSFRDRIAGNGEGYLFATRVVDRYFRDRIGTQDKLVIAQLSGTERSLLWEGTPLTLRKKFPTADSFRDFLLKKADPNGSQVTKGLRHALQYVLSDPQVASGKAKASVFVLSDMIDSAKDEREEGYLNHELSQLGWHGAALGIYYADQQEVVRWRHRLRFLGVKNFCVVGDIMGEPAVPEFEQ